MMKKLLCVALLGLFFSASTTSFAKPLDLDKVVENRPPLPD